MFESRRRESKLSVFLEIQLKTLLPQSVTGRTPVHFVTRKSKLSSAWHIAPELKFLIVKYTTLHLAIISRRRPGNFTKPAIEIRQIIEPCFEGNPCDRPLSLEQPTSGPGNPNFIHIAMERTARRLAKKATESLRREVNLSRPARLGHIGISRMLFHPGENLLQAKVRFPGFR